MNKLVSSNEDKNIKLEHGNIRKWTLYCNSKLREIVNFRFCKFDHFINKRSKMMFVAFFTVIFQLLI